MEHDNDPDIEQEEIEKQAQIDAAMTVAADLPDGAFMEMMAEHGVDPTDLEALEGECGEDTDAKE